ncbi:hypothetical protein OSTOST_06619 [Ostertagia ostertagi]
MSLSEAQGYLDQIALIDAQLSANEGLEDRASLMEMRADLVELVQLLKEQARVLYSHPMVNGMRPCSHFLAGTCRFEGKCKFSHGEIVSMADLNEYKEPDFNTLTVGSLVLVSVTTSPPLWEIGRLMAIDHGEVAVKVIEEQQ